MLINTFFGGAPSCVIGPGFLYGHVQLGSDETSADYVVVNIVGLVACAAVGESDALPFADGLWFNELVINPKDARGLLLFRLAESKMDVLVCESVARRIESLNLPFLTLEPLREAAS